ncbi:hypothetical protein BRC93_03490 [Halobacteriales archaeon QS_5_70_15]|nr:MAG: hypothetical protein BRC93_03490 [Halobacteriales archaeon QS_5_70_15]
MTTRWLTDAHDTNMELWLTAWDEAVLPFWEREFECILREGEPSYGRLHLGRRGTHPGGDAPRGLSGGR